MAKDDTELLNYVFQNSEMGVDTISKLIEMTDNSEFKHQLETQKQEYEAMQNDAKKLLKQRGTSEDELSAFDKIRTYIMINIQTMTDKSVSHIAQMLMEGSTMGIVQALRKIRNYTDTGNDIHMLMKKLLQMEENNFEQLKKYI